MSGIYGFVRCESDVIDTTSLNKWNKLYGKNQVEIKKEGNLFIGCSYENISISPNCPTIIIEDETRICAIDALLYNREELVKKCSIIENISNEELLYRYIVRFGINSLEDVNGDFAGVIYEKEKGEFILFRDHMGVRPLYYYSDSKGIYFSTDIRGLLGMKNLNIQVSEKWIYMEMMGAQNMSPVDTEYENVYCVLPGGYISGKISDSNISIQEKKYWEIGKRKIRYSSEKEYQKQLRTLITDSIKRRSEAVNVKLGAELSGGLDSCVIDIILKRLGKEVTYFSWSYDPSELEYAKDDERLVIEDVCKQEGFTCNYSHRGAQLDSESIIAKNMKSIGYVFDGEPDIWTYAFPPFINTDDICHTSQFLHEQGVGVVFSGHGGDEGVSHRCAAYEMVYNKEYYHFYRYMLAKVPKNKKLRTLRALKHSFEYIQNGKKKYNQPFKHIFNTPDIMTEYLSSKFSPNDLPILTFAYDPIEYVKHGGSRNRLDVVAVFGAFNGVRYLLPYIDYRVIDYAVSIPRYLYITPRADRSIYRETFKDIMPKSLYDVNYKSANSYSGTKGNEDWQSIFTREKDLHASKLDRSRWSKYINFEKIDSWAYKEEANIENYNDQFSIMLKLNRFIMAESAIKYSRNFDNIEK